jgi:hypothetical protein
MQVSMAIQVLIAIVVVLMINRARSGQKIPKIRRLAGLDALDEAIGRATEMGRPIMFFPGGAALSDAQTMASFSVLGYVGRSCARYDTRLIAVCGSGVPVYTVMEGIVREAYTTMGKQDSFDSTMVRLLALGWGAFTSAAMGTMQREQSSANLYFGAFFAETMMLTEIGGLMGAIQVGSTAQTAQLPFFIAACDYTLIGEELYASGAYLSTDVIPKANLIVMDYFKIATVICLVIGVVLAQAGNTWLADFIRM